MKRTKYPTRNAWLRNETGLEPEKVHVPVTAKDLQYKQLCNERVCLYCKTLTVESLADFKAKFKIEV